MKNVVSSYRSRVLICDRSPLPKFEMQRRPSNVNAVDDLPEISEEKTLIEDAPDAKHDRPWIVPLDV